MAAILYSLGIISIFLLNFIHGENILFLSVPFYGHLNPMVKTADQLAKIGHTSHLVISESFRTKFHPINKGVNFIVLEDFPEVSAFQESSLKFFSLKNHLFFWKMLSDLDRLCDRYLFNEKLFQKLKSLNFSMAVVDGNFISICQSVLAYKLDIPFIFLGLHIQLTWHRTPWSPATFPNKLFTFPEKMSFLQRLANTLTIMSEYFYPLGIPSRPIKEYVPERPDIDFKDLIKQVKLFIMDCDVFMDYALPALPNVLYIGGLATIPAKSLEGPLFEFVNTSKHGVIVVSPGTLVSWSDDHLKKMSEAFSKLKYDVVWKHSNSSFSRRNVFPTKWLPQNDLLGHRNTKLFITHCGNSGQYESLYHAVPMIGFPVFADQFYNCHRIQIKGYGISMNADKFTVEELVKNIEQLIENVKYKKRILKASKMFRSQKESPAERAARHIDEILEYGGDHLRSACQDIPLYQFLMLDICTFLLLAFFIILLIIHFITKKCFRIFCGKIKIKSE